MMTSSTQPQPHDDPRSFSGRQRVLLETNKARDKAEILLQELMRAQRAFNQPENPENAGATVRCVAQNSESVTVAIRSTRRLIDALNRALDLASDDIDDEDMAMLDTLDCELDCELEDDLETLALIDDPESLQAMIGERSASSTPAKA